MIDDDNNGIVDEEEFRNLIGSLGIIEYEEDVNALLQIIDPNNNKQMNFSEIIQLLSSQMMSANDGSNR